MSIQHKLKGVQKFRRVKGAMAATVLGVAAMAAPLKGHAAEATPDKASVSASEMADSRHQQLEAAIRAGLPQEEIVKYVDFPDFIPATKEGQFDEERADELTQKLQPYMETLRKKGNSIKPEEAYKVYKQSMGKSAVSFEEFKQVNDFFVEQVASAKKEGKSVRYSALGLALVMTGWILLAAKAAMRHSSWKDIIKEPVVMSCSIVFAELAAVIFGATFLVPSVIGNDGRMIKDACKRMYDSYVHTVLQQKDPKEKPLNVVEWKGSFPKTNDVARKSSR